MKQLIVLFTLIFTVSAFAGDKTIKLSVNGMTCNSCASTVEKALKGVDGVSDAKVDLNQKFATVTLASNSKTTTAMLVKAVDKTGFTAIEGKPDTKKEQSVKQSDDGCGDGCCEPGEYKKEMKNTKKTKKEVKKS